MCNCVAGRTRRRPANLFWLYISPGDDYSKTNQFPKRPFAAEGTILSGETNVRGLDAGLTTLPGGELVIKLAGFLDSYNFSEFDELLTEAMANHGVKIILDFSELVQISSAGAGVLAIASEKALAGGGRIVVCGANELVEKTLQMLGIVARSPEALGLLLAPDVSQAVLLLKLPPTGPKPN